MCVLVCPIVWWHTAAIWEDLDWREEAESDWENEAADECRGCIDDGSGETARGCNISITDSESSLEGSNGINSQ